MSRIVAIGEELKLAGYALAGVEVVAADGPEAIQAAWNRLGTDVGLVLVTAEAACGLPELAGRPDLLYVALPG
jgi:vacuolar-type H+-ATPase subunit F/Vma7